MWAATLSLWVSQQHTRGFTDRPFSASTVHLKSHPSSLQHRLFCTFIESEGCLNNRRHVSLYHRSKEQDSTTEHSVTTSSGTAKPGSVDLGGREALLGPYFAMEECYDGGIRLLQMAGMSVLSQIQRYQGRMLI